MTQFTDIGPATEIDNSEHGIKFNNFGTRRKPLTEQVSAWKDYFGEIGDLTVLDDYFSRPLRGAISSLFEEPIWGYGWKSNGKSDRFSFWHAQFAGGGMESRTSCERELQLSAPKAIQAAWQVLKSGPLAGHVPLRVYANAHTYGIEGYMHSDNTDKENYYTTVYYAHREWRPNWAGETIFYTMRDNDASVAVSPKPGRMVTFHGAIPHRALAPSRACEALRLCLVLKTQREAQ